jgi:hypothetical protein
VAGGDDTIRPGTDVRNIFDNKFGVFFAQTTTIFLQKFDHDNGLQEKRQFFRRNFGQIAENCDHNIDSNPPGPI